MASKKQQIIKRDAGTLANSQNAQLMRELISTNSPFYSIEVLMEGLAEKMVANKGKGHSREFYGDFWKGVVALGLFTHVPIAETAKEEYRIFLVEMVKNIECEYDCKTPSEKALAEIIASSYIRTIQYSRELTLCTKGQELSHEKNGYFSVVSKELDRANRHYTNALLTLKQLKSPSLEVSIKAKNAFIAQNQQFNTSVDQNKQNENNDHQ